MADSSREMGLVVMSQNYSTLCRPPVNSRNCGDAEKNVTDQLEFLFVLFSFWQSNIVKKKKKCFLKSNQHDAMSLKANTVFNLDRNSIKSVYVCCCRNIKIKR